MIEKVSNESFDTSLIVSDFGINQRADWVCSKSWQYILIAHWLLSPESLTDSMLLSVLLN